MTHRITRADSTVPEMPVTLEQVKQHLKIEHDDEDALFRMYLVGAVEWCEEITHRAIAQRNYLVVRDTFPSTFWRLPLGYVDSITNVQYIDTDGATQTWDASNYSLDNDSDSAARLRPVPTTSWPDVGEYDSAARVTCVAGWTVPNCPYAIRTAILQRVGQLSESRAPGDPDADAMERATRMMLAPWVLPIWS